jgi:ATP-dependent Lhr-like helicase
MLLTTESLSLLLSYPDAAMMFENLRSIVVDELHGFAQEKRGDLLSLSMSRLQTLAPGLRRVGLSATISDPDAYRSWLAPDADMDQVDLVMGDPGADPDLSILIPENKIPWGGHSGYHAVPEVMRLIEQHKTTLVFCNTRGLAELIFQKPGRERAGAAGLGSTMAAYPSKRGASRGGDGGGKAARACRDREPRSWNRLGRRRPRRSDGRAQGKLAPVAASAAPTTASTSPAKGSSSRATASNIWKPGPRWMRSTMASSIPRSFVLERWMCLRNCPRHGGLGAVPAGGASHRSAVRSALCRPQVGELSRRSKLHRHRRYALKAYDRFSAARAGAGGMWRISKPSVAQQHRLNAGVIVEQPLLSVRFRNGRKLGTIEEGYASTLAPGDHFYFAGLSLEVEQFKDTDIIVRASSKSARIVNYGGQRMSMSTHLANRVRQMLCDRNDWSRFPGVVRAWLEVQSERSVLPEPHQLLVETFPHEGQHFMVAYSFEGWNAHQSLGMLLTKRMEKAGLKPLGFVANDYALACYGLEPITDPRSLFSADILEQEFIDWVESSYLLKTAFREVAVIGGLVERHHPGKKKSGRQVSFSTDLIYDVLRRYEPQHLLLRAAWDDAGGA